MRASGGLGVTWRLMAEIRLLSSYNCSYPTYCPPGQFGDFVAWLSILRLHGQVYAGLQALQDKYQIHPKPLIPTSFKPLTAAPLSHNSEPQPAKSTSPPPPPPKTKNKNRQLGVKARHPPTPPPARIITCTPRCSGQNRAPQNPKPQHFSF